MKAKQTAKRIIDILMILLLPVLMLEIQTGQELHEWLGVGMGVCFIIHLVLNVSWYKNLFKGNYSPVRALQAVINILLSVDILALIISGIMMSGFVFTWLNISGGILLARKLHLFASYWGLILMSGHLGLNLNVLLGALRKLFRIEKESVARKWILRILAIGISVYGVYVFISQKIYQYLFLQTHFVIFDETKSMVIYLLETIAMIVLFAAIFYALQKCFSKIICGDKAQKVCKCTSLSATFVVLGSTIAVFSIGQTSAPSWGDNKPDSSVQSDTSVIKPDESVNSNGDTMGVKDNLIFIKGGSFLMGSPESESWRSDDETQHTVTVSDFYISPYEVTQQEYEAVTGNNPSYFSGDDLPIENISWLDAVKFCNSLSEKENLTPVYMISDNGVTWDRSANGYRLPTEAEWEYACRAGTTTPFNTENSLSAEQANYYGHYPYHIEENYFSQGNLETKPGEYRQTTVSVNSFSPNKWGLYCMHGNVSEWVWDSYGAYGTENQTDPTGAETGNRRVYRGGGWNDFAKNMRSAYRATMAQDQGSFNIGIRLVHNANAGSGTVTGNNSQQTTEKSGKVLIAYFSWGGNTAGIAEEIRRKTGADLFEIELVHPYSDSYNTVLDQAQHDQNINARPEIKNKVENFEQYDTILIGYPNWWASIPMPIASFLEEYDFSGKRIIPFCSHGGGRFGQSLTAIAKLAPNATMGEPLSIHYSGGSTLRDDIAEWLSLNNIN